MIVRRVKDDEGEWLICREERRRYNMLIARVFDRNLGRGWWRRVGVCHDMGETPLPHSPFTL